MDKINELKNKYMRMEDDEHFISYSVLVELLDDLESFRPEPKTYKDELLLKLGKLVIQDITIRKDMHIKYLLRSDGIAGEICDIIEKIKEIKDE